MSKVAKLCIIVYFLSTAAAFFFLRNSPSKEYELSIYANAPLFSILFLVAGTIAGIGIIAYHALAERRYRWESAGYSALPAGAIIVYDDRPSRWWLAGYAMLLFNMVALLSLPHFRGYYFYMHADPVAHWGWTQEMLSTHHLDPTNIYPILHLNLLNVALATTISPRVLMATFPGWLSFLWMLYTYLFASALFKQRKVVLLAAAASVVPLFMTYQVPVIAQSIAHLQFPMFVYLYFMSLSDGSLKYKAPLLGYLIGIPFAHPIPSLVLLFALVALEAVRLIYMGAVHIERDESAPRLPKEFNFFSPALVGVIFFTWISASVLFAPQIQFSYDVLQGKYNIPALSELGATRYMSQIELIIWIIRSYGHLAVFLVFAACGVLILVDRVRRGQHGYAYAFIFLVVALGGDIFLTILNVATGQEALYYRSLIMDQLVYFSPLMVAFALPVLVSRLKLRHLGKVAACTAVIGLAYAFSFFSLFPSPWVYQRSIHITRMDIASHDWFFAQQRLGYIYTGLNVPHGLATFSLGYKASVDSAYTQRSAAELTRGTHMYESIPPHFGQRAGRRWGEIVPFDLAFFQSDHYTKGLLDPVISKAWVGFLERRDFTMQDIDRLKFDSSVDRLYSNGPMSLLYVRMTRG